MFWIIKLKNMIIAVNVINLVTYNPVTYNNLLTVSNLQRVCYFKRTIYPGKIRCDKVPKVPIQRVVLHFSMDLYLSNFLNFLSYKTVSHFADHI